MDFFSLEDWREMEREAIQQRINEERATRVLEYGESQVSFFEHLADGDWASARKLFDRVPDEIDLLHFDYDGNIKDLLWHAKESIAAGLDDEDSEEDESEEMGELQIDHLYYLVDKAIEKGIRLKLNDRFETLLHSLCRNSRDREFVQTILRIATPDDLNCYNQVGRTPLLEALAAGNHIVASLLASDERVDINAFVIERVDTKIFTQPSKEHGISAVQLSRDNGFHDIERIITRRRDYDESVKYLQPSNDVLEKPLARMFVQSNTATIRSLIRTFGKEIFKIRDGLNWSVLHIAAYAKNLPVVRLLLDASQINSLLPEEQEAFRVKEYKIFVNATSNNGSTTAFGRGIIHSETSKDIILMFLNSPHFDPNCRQSTSVDSLAHYLVGNGETELLYEAAKNPFIDFDGLDSDDNTPLRIAVEESDYETIEQLALLQRLGKTISPHDVGNKKEIARVLSLYDEESWFGDSVTITGVNIAKLIKLYETHEPIKVSVTYNKTHIDWNFVPEDEVDPDFLADLERSFKYLAEDEANSENTICTIRPDWLNIPYNILNISLDDRTKRDVDPKYHNLCKVREVFRSEAWCEEGKCILDIEGIGKITITKTGERSEQVAEPGEINYKHLKWAVEKYDRHKMSVAKYEPLAIVAAKKGDFNSFRALLSFDEFDFKDEIMEGTLLTMPSLPLEIEAYYFTQKMRRKYGRHKFFDELVSSLEHGRFLMPAIDDSGESNNQIAIAKSARTLLEELLKNIHGPQMQFARLFVQRLAIANLKRINLSLKGQPHSRRLDAFARMLEGNGTCAAVCFDGQKILFSANFPGGYDKAKHMEMINNVRQYLAKFAREDFKHLSDLREHRRTLLNEICILKLLPALQGLNKTAQQVIFPKAKEFITRLIVLMDSNFKLLVDYEAAYELDDYGALSFESTKQILDLFELDYEESAAHVYSKANYKDINLSMVLTGVIRAILDIRKLENSISLKNFSQFSPEVISTIKQLDGTGFELIEEGLVGVHAEMRIINSILSEEAKQKHYYVGISKLCCSHCKFCFDNLSHFSHDSLRNWYQARGSHGMSFEWPVPHFLTTSQGFANVFSLDYFLVEAHRKTEETEPGSAVKIMTNAGNLTDPRLPFFSALNITKSDGRRIVADWSSSRPEASTIFRFNQLESVGPAYD